MTKGKPPRLRQLWWLRNNAMKSQPPLLAMMQGGEYSRFHVLHLPTSASRERLSASSGGETRTSATEHSASCHSSIACARENRSWYKAWHRRRRTATRSGEENDSSRSAATSSMLSRFKTHPTPNSLIHFAMEQSSDPSNRTGLPAANAPKNLEGTTVPVQEGRRLTTCTSAQLSRASSCD